MTILTVRPMATALGLMSAIALVLFGSVAMAAPPDNGDLEMLLNPPPQPVEVLVRFDEATGLYDMVVKGRRPYRNDWLAIRKKARDIFGLRKIIFLDDTGRARYVMPRTMLGVVIEPVVGALASQLRLGEEEALVVTEIVRSLPAERSGLRVHDVIVTANGHRPMTRDVLTRLMDWSGPGDTINCKVLREGRRIELELRLAEFNPEIMDAVDAERRSWEGDLDGVAFGAEPAPRTIDRTVVMRFRADDGGVERLVVPHNPNAAAGGVLAIEDRLQLLDERLEGIEFILNLLLERESGRMEQPQDN